MIRLVAAVGYRQNLIHCRPPLAPAGDYPDYVSRLALGSGVLDGLGFMLGTWQWSGKSGGVKAEHIMVVGCPP